MRRRRRARGAPAGAAPKGTSRPPAHVAVYVRGGVGAALGGGGPPAAHDATAHRARPLPCGVVAFRKWVVPAPHQKVRGVVIGVPLITTSRPGGFVAIVTSCSVPKIAVTVRGWSHVIAWDRWSPSVHARNG